MKIIELRKQKKMTQADLAERCHTTQQTIAKIENGVVDPKLSTLRRLAEALRCEIPDLFYTRKEFLARINEVARKEKLDLKKVDLLELNARCTEAAHLPPYHPYWEEVIVKNGFIRFKEDTNEN